VVESSPADDETHTNGLLALGVAHRGLKEYDLAKAAWERVVKAAPKGNMARADALFNLAILEMDFLEKEKSAAEAFDRFLEDAPEDHPKRKAAKQRRKELQL
jgi:tetratricopeptide (TPR) repeat protein